VTATCTGNGILLGGGFSVSNTSSIVVLESAPTTGGVNGTWSGEVVNNSSFSSESPTVTVYAVCSK